MSSKDKQKDPPPRNYEEQCEETNVEENERTSQTLLRSEGIFLLTQ